MGLFLWSAVFLLLLQSVPIPSSLDGPPSSAEAVSSPPLVLSTHSPIVIEGDENFTRENGVVSGDGTASNPYVIENYTIRLNSSGTGILIKNTTKHFVIRNCTLMGSQSPGGSVGIRLQNVSNGEILNVYLTYLYHDIYVLDSFNIVIKKNKFLDNERMYDAIRVDDSRDVYILNNSVSGNFEGIRINRCEGCLIANNLIKPFAEGIRLLSTVNSQIINNTIDGGLWTAISIDYSNNITVRKNINKRSSYGIAVVDSAGCIIENNTSLNNTRGGIALLYSTEIYVKDNVLSGNRDYGMYILWLNHSVIRNNTVIHNRVHGMFLFWSSYLSIENNTVMWNGRSGIDLNHTSFNVIANNTVSQNIVGGINLTISEGERIRKNICEGNGYAGISLASCRDVIVEKTRLKRNYHGVYLLRDNRECVIRNTTLINNTYGLFLEGARYLSIDHNKLENSKYTITLTQNSSFNRITNNSVENSTSYGLFITMSPHNTIFSNVIRGNAVGIRVWKSHDLLVYNNYFNNTMNYDLSDNYNLLWNVEKVESRNIVGGPYIGGNYWSDYGGEDIDGDGLGDTELPYGPGDYHPLLIDFPPPDSEPPWAVYVGDEEGRTGEEMSISFRIYDNRSLFGVVADLNFTFKGLGNVTIVNGMREGLRPDERGEISFNLSVPINSTGLLLNLTLVDFSKNVGHVSWYIPVNDTILPEIVEHSAGDFRTGESATFTIVVRDNIGVGRVFVEYVMDCGETDLFNGTVMLAEVGEGRYEGVLEIPVNAESIMYRYRVEDMSGNVVNTEWFREDVLDTVRPYVEFISEGLPETGRNYTMRFMIVDNIGAGDVGLEVVFNGDIAIRPDLISVDGGIWEGRVLVPENAVVLYYNLSVEDLGGNVGYLAGSIEVVDIIPPGFKDITVNPPQTGREYKMELNFWDNVRVEGGYIEWSYDGGEWRNKTFECGWISGVVEVLLGRVPENATILHYRVGVVDEGGNWLIWEGKKAVEDVIAPVVELEIGEALTSHFLVVSLDVRDNIGVENVSFRYSFDDEVWEECESENYTYRIWLPSDVEHVKIRVEVYDVGGNRGERVKSIEVGDGTPPEIVKVKVWGSKGRLRFEVYVIDNRGGEVEVWVTLWDSRGRFRNVTLERVEGSRGHFRGELDVGGEVRYAVWASDGSGNVNSTVEKEVEVEEGIHNVVVVAVVMVLIAGVVFLYYMRRGGRLAEE